MNERGKEWLLPLEKLHVKVSVMIEWHSYLISAVAKNSSERLEQDYATRISTHAGVSWIGTKTSKASPKFQV